VGSPDFDNTRESRTLGGTTWQELARAPLDDDPLALRSALWDRTERVWHQAQERYANLRSEVQMAAPRGDSSADFSAAGPVRLERPLAVLEIDLEAWRARLVRHAALFLDHPRLVGARVDLEVTTTDRYLVDTGGTRVVTSAPSVRLSVYAETKAEDGMELYLAEVWDRSGPSGLPGEAEVATVIRRLIGNLEALRTAPVTEPYTGPAILLNRAAGVFIHEIFGHRVEGHRQKSDEEGQTYTAKLGERIMPPFLDVYDDPTLTTYAGEDLKGNYEVDDEGVRPERVDLVVQGVLRAFLMSRSPIAAQSFSNGHGRRESGYRPVARQGNLIVQSSKSISYNKLRLQLIDLVKKQKKPYGLIFADISGGFTLTGRSLPQSFKVEPLLVWRVYPDGRPDELVRGVDLVGTPLTSLSRIVAAGDDPAVFDGWCGAESGQVPVSAAAPSLLVSELEVEKRRTSPLAGPLLEPPPRSRPVEEGGDPVLAAMEDELTRSMDDLYLPEGDRPYHLRYTITDRNAWILRAYFGALTIDLPTRDRTLTAELRVGDTRVDNTRFVTLNRGPWRPEQEDLPVAADYGSVRQGLWQATDRAFKDAVARLAAKRSWLRQSAPKDRPEDYSTDRPLRSLVPGPPPGLDRDIWRDRLRAATARFRDDPLVGDAQAQLQTDASVRRMLDSDGGLVRAPLALFELVLSARGRASDGSPQVVYRLWRTPDPTELPDESALAAAADTLRDELHTLLTAPEGEPYIGPLLLTGEASGAFLAQVLAAGLANPRGPEFEEDTFARFFDDAGALGRRLNRRVLPEDVQVRDDPALERWAGRSLLGHYTVDEEGLPAVPLEVVTDGWLRTLPMSRTPTRERTGSNGHGRAAFGLPVLGKPSTLLVESTAPQSEAGMRALLRELAERSQLPYVLVAERLHDPVVQGRFDREGLVQQRLEDSPAANPMLVRRLWLDGRVEMVRGYRFEGVDARTLRDIAALGDTPHLVQALLDGASGDGVPISVIAPDLLLEEVALTPMGGRRPVPLPLGRPMPASGTERGRSGTW
jgi:TldD protein